MVRFTRVSRPTGISTRASSSLISPCKPVAVLCSVLYPLRGGGRVLHQRPLCLALLESPQGAQCELTLIEERYPSLTAPGYDHPASGRPNFTHLLSAGWLPKGRIRNRRWHWFPSNHLGKGITGPYSGPGAAGCVRSAALSVLSYLACPCNHWLSRACSAGLPAGGWEAHSGKSSASGGSILLTLGLVLQGY